MNGSKRVKGPDVPILRTAPPSQGGRKPENMRGPRLVASNGQPVSRGLTKGDAARLRDEQKIAAAITRAEAILASEEPTTDQAKSIALRVLKEVALRGADPTMVAASKVLLDYATKAHPGDEDRPPPDLGDAFGEGDAQTRQ